MDVVIERCAGLDVHKQVIVGSVRVPGQGLKRQVHTQTFSSMTQELLKLSDWLASEGVTHVAMESTGVYWRPVYAILEGAFEVLLVNARHVKNVPGRKTDVRDSEWLAQLLECGLLKGSFIPPKPIRDLRDLTRYRKVLIRERGHHVNRVAKTLELANIKLGSVATDLMGKTGRAIIEALIAGETDPDRLADLAQGSLKKKRSALREAVKGKITPHYAFLLKQQLHVIDDLAHRIEEFDERIEACMRPLDDGYRCVLSMPGIAERAAQAILAEIGTDMSCFPTAAHLASWARICPSNNESAGKRRSTKTGKANSWLRATLNEAAWAAVKKKDSYYRALYQRMKARQGPKKAIGTVQHAMLRALWFMLSRRVLHQDLGVDYFTRSNVAKIRHHHIRRLEQLGCRVIIEEAA
jgi:transposase